MAGLLQLAIDATPTYGTLRLPVGRFRINSTLVIDRPMKVVGAGCFAISKSFGTGGAFDSPNVSPNFGGTVLEVGAVATDAIHVTVTANSVDLSDFGIRFVASQDTNTGHGIVAQSSLTYSSGSEHGLFHSTWENIQVFGHDGNHSAFKAINPLHVVMRKLRSYGGGGFHWQCDSYAGNYGNTTFDSPFAHVYNAGTAHGYFMQGRTTSGTAGVLNLLTFIRPQCNSTGSTASQYLFLGVTAGISANNMTIIGPDFESPVGSPINFGSGTMFVDPSGIFGKADDATSKEFRIFRAASIGGGKVLNSDLSFNTSNTPAPTIAAGAGAGSGATVSLSGDDARGTISLTSGTSPTTFAALFTVTFAKWTGATAVILTARNGTAGKINVYVSSVTGTAWTVNAAGVAVDASASLSWNYQVIR